VHLVLIRFTISSPHTLGKAHVYSTRLQSLDTARIPIAIANYDIDKSISCLLDTSCWCHSLQKMHFAFDSIHYLETSVTCR